MFTKICQLFSRWILVCARSATAALRLKRVVSQVRQLVLANVWTKIKSIQKSAPLDSFANISLHSTQLSANPHSFNLSSRPTHFLYQVCTTAAATTTMINQQQLSSLQAYLDLAWKTCLRTSTNRKKRWRHARFSKMKMNNVSAHQHTRAHLIHSPNTRSLNRSIWAVALLTNAHKVASSRFSRRSADFRLCFQLSNLCAEHFSYCWDLTNLFLA